MTFPVDFITTVVFGLRHWTFLLDILYVKRHKFTRLRDKEITVSKTESSHGLASGSLRRWRRRARETSVDGSNRQRCLRRILSMTNSP